MEQIKNDLLKGKTVLGKWYVRPLSWAGIWKNGEDGETLLVEGNTLFTSDSEADCDVFMMNYTLLKLIEENPTLPIVPMTYYEVLGGDSGYWLGKIESIEIREYAINEWNDEDAVMFRDEPDAEKSLIDSIIKFKYNDDENHIDDAKRDAEAMWTKAIIIRINL